MEKEIIFFDTESKSVVTETGFRYRDTVSVEKSREMVSGDSPEAVFEKFYAKNEKYKYCNGTHYKFADPEDERAYSEWIKTALTVEFYMKHGGDMW